MSNLSYWILFLFLFSSLHLSLDKHLLLCFSVSRSFSFILSICPDILYYYVYVLYFQFFRSTHLYILDIFFLPSLSLPSFFFNSCPPICSLSLSPLLFTLSFSATLFHFICVSLGSGCQNSGLRIRLDQLRLQEQTGYHPKQNPDPDPAKK